MRRFAPQHAARTSFACALLLVLAGAEVARRADAQTVLTLGGFVGSNPVGLAVDDAGDVLYDTLFDFSGGGAGVKVLLASHGRVPTSNPTRITIGGGFRFPHGLAVDPATLDVFVADLGNNTVKQIVFADHSIRTLGSGFSQPSALARDAHGNVFVIDGGGLAIKQIVAIGGAIPDNPTVRTLGVAGQRNFVGPALGLEADAAGDVYFLDVPNPGYATNALKRWSAVGGVLPDHPTAVTVAIGFFTPTDAAIDRYGNVFVCDQDGNAIEQVVAVDGAIPLHPTILALGSGFNHPTRLGLDTYGNVYVADGANQVIKEILLSDTIFRDGLEPPPRAFPPPSP